MNENTQKIVALPPTRATLLWLELIRDPRWSQRQKIRLIQEHGSPESILTLQGELYRQSKPKPGAGAVRQSGKYIEGDIGWLEQPHHYLIAYDDVRYPKLLREIYDPPIALFAKGDLNSLSAPMVAIVGSRNPTPVGTRVAEQIARDLASAGITIVSGLALGVDAAAHRGALQSSNSTAAVLGSGIDTIYPARNRHLYHDICRSGCVLSEYPLGTPPSRYNFPTRNRIVSGLCVGTVIIEAADKSGTLVTARIASEQNRDVCVVPGSALSRQYHGSHRLIQQGAAIVSSASDVLRELELPLKSYLSRGHKTLELNTQDDPAMHRTASPLAEQIKRCLSSDSTHLTELIQTSGLTSTEVSSILLELELSGSVAIANDGGYVLLE